MALQHWQTRVTSEATYTILTTPVLPRNYGRTANGKTLQFRHING